MQTKNVINNNYVNKRLHNKNVTIKNVIIKNKKTLNNITGLKYTCNQYKLFCYTTLTAHMLLELNYYYVF